jgi:hypothetical protein|tara:strand:- start:923 stop:1210 length:288 start_codon:yes stop_codon:yes gene_type:complete
MTLPELIDNLIELSCEEMPQEAKDALDDAIDHLVTSMTDVEMNQLFKKGFEKMDLLPKKSKPLKFDKGDEPYLRDEILEQEEILNQVINGKIALA